MSYQYTDEWQIQTEADPLIEPLSLDEAKSFLRLDTTTEDWDVDAGIRSSREHVEHRTALALVPRVLNQYFDCWPEGNHFRLRIGPLISVAGLVYKDEDGVETTWAATNYIADTFKRIGLLVLADGISWPSGNLYPSSAIKIQYVAGYSKAGTGTISTSSTTITGVSSLLTTELVEGDLIIASGQVRAVSAVTSATGATLDAAFSSNLAAGTAYRVFNADMIPQSLRDAMKILISTQWENREDLVLTMGRSSQLIEIPTVRRLLANYVNRA